MAEDTPGVAPQGPTPTPPAGAPAPVVGPTTPTAPSPSQVGLRHVHGPAGERPVIAAVEPADDAARHRASQAGRLVAHADDTVAPRPSLNLRPPANHTPARPKGRRWAFWAIVVAVLAVAGVAAAYYVGKRPEPASIASAVTPPSARPPADAGVPPGTPPKAQPAAMSDEKKDVPPPAKPGCCKPEAEIRFFPNGQCKLIGVKKLEEAPEKVQQMWREMCKPLPPPAPPKVVYKRVYVPVVRKEPPMMYTPPPPPAISEACTPNGPRQYIVWIFSMAKLPADIQQRIVSAREKGYRQLDAISRGSGREIVERGGMAALSTLPLTFPVKINGQFYKTVTITGKGVIELPPVVEQEKLDFEPASAVYPTPASGDQVHRLRTFWYEWKGCKLNSVMIVP